MQKIPQSKFKNFNDLIFPIDKFSNFLFAANVPTFDNLIEDKHLNIKSPVKIIFPKDNFGNIVNLTPTDKLILIVLISAQLAGNEYISYAQLFHLLGGGENYKNAKKIQNIIDNALWKFRCTDVTIDLTDISYARKKYSAKLKIPYNAKDKDRQKIVWRGVLLPNEVITASVNGIVTDGVIHFLGKSIIFDIADLKDQIARADLKLISSISIRTTETTLTLTGYLLERILKIKGSNDESQKHVTRLNNSISFNTIFKECGISAETRKQCWDARQNALKILDSFKAQNFISDYELIKTTDGDFSIEISFQIYGGGYPFIV